MADRLSLGELEHPGEFVARHIGTVDSQATTV